MSLQEMDSSIIDKGTFEQILEMDDDEDERDFSKSIVFDFFSQAESTFKKMDVALATKDDDALKELSELGHFLKGSSATLGLTKVKDSCEHIQNFGQKKDATGLNAATEKESWKNLGQAVVEAKDHFTEAEKVLKKFYDNSP